MLKALLFSTAVSLVAGFGVSAQAEPASKTCAAAANELGFLVGRWSASAQYPDSGKVEQLDYRVEPGAGCAWLAGAGSAPDGSFDARDMWGRDPRTNEVVRVLFDSSGALGTFRSPGWNGDTLVLEGEVLSGNGAARFRQTITRLNSDTFKAVWEAHRDGAWKAYLVETVTRKT